ncbi:aldose 1-epimerase family protein [Bremerella sp. JC770]|uniref:aldose 1-epimerase family protein n=1 Tax=Bremerella sp. JC770 TaxID=3232137 RepID=UPI003458FAAE
MNNRWILSEYDITSPYQQPAPFLKATKQHGYEVTHTRLFGGRRDGVELLSVKNGDFSFTTIPSRGMGIHQAKHGDTRLGWQSPVEGPVHPQFVPLSDPSGLGWLDGMDELIVRCGLESNGAPEFDAETGRLKYGLHGRIANQPTEDVIIEVSPEGELCISGEVRETRFLVYNVMLETEIRTKPGENGFRIHDRIVNRAAQESTAQMLYHINLGVPILGEGASVVCPVSQLCPRDARAVEDVDTWSTYKGPTDGYAEQVYFMQLAADENGNTCTLLKNAAGDQGVSVQFNVKQLPCFVLWKNTAATSDGYVTGLEPATNFPNTRSFEEKNDRVLKLAPGATYEFDLALQFHPDAASVQAVEQKIAALTDGKEATVHTTPQAEWCG